MGGSYGYNPAEYANNFSWMGEIGNHIGKLALQMPELIELNKEIKENTKFKQRAYTAANQFLDSLESGELGKVASAMGIQYGNNDEARNKLREMIPQFENDQVKNEDYAKQITESFFSPFLQAAQSDKAGDPLTIGHFLAKVKNGTLQESIRKTSVGEQMVRDEQYNKAMKDKYGDYWNPGVSEVGAQQAATLAGQIKTTQAENDIKRGEEQKQYNLDQQRSIALMQPVNSAIESITGSYEQSKQRPKAYKEATKYAKDMNFNAQQTQFLLEQVNKYFDDLLNQEKESALESDRDQDRIKKLRERTNPVINPEQVSSVANVAQGKLISAQQTASSLSTRKDVKPEELVGAEEAVKNANLNSELHALVRDYYTAQGDFTAQGLARATQEANQEIHKRIFDREKPFIQQTVDAINNGKKMKIDSKDIRNAAQKGRIFTKDQLENSSSVIQGYNYLKLMGYGDFIEVSPDHKSIMIRSYDPSHSFSGGFDNSRVFKLTPNDSSESEEVIRVDTKTGKRAVFNKNTKQFIRWVE